MRHRFNAAIRLASFNFFKGFAVGTAVGTWFNVFFGVSAGNIAFTLIVSIVSGAVLAMMEQQKQR
jgi:hypothetical protein